MMQLPAERLSCGFFPELNNGAAPVEFLPMNQWRKLMLNFSRDQTITESNFVEEPFGYRPLREAISQYVLRKKGIRCSADQVVLFLDAMYSFYAAAQLIIDSGDVVAMEDPGFPYARMCIQLLNAEIMPVPVTDTGLDVERIKKSERKIDVVFITPSHQDPLGGTMPLAARNSLVDWAADTGAVILEDDYDNDFFYGASPLPALMSLDKRGQVYYFGNFYKVLYPLSAAGYVIVPPQMVDVFAKAMTLGMNSSPARFSMHEELAMTAMLNEGILEKHLRKAQSGYAERRYQLIASLTKALRGVVQISSVNGGMNLIVTVDTKYSTDFVLSCAKDAGLPMASTADYYFQEALPNQFLIAFAIMPPAKTEAMISKFAALLTA
jgi:GntR family transcriptional regulator/MocR family aminotransferase